MILIQAQISYYLLNWFKKLNPDSFFGLIPDRGVQIVSFY